MMTREEVQALRDGATKGPWACEPDDPVSYVSVADAAPYVGIAFLSLDNHKANAALIAAAPTLAADLLAALDEIERLRAAISACAAFDHDCVAKIAIARSALGQP